MKIFRTLFLSLLVSLLSNNINSQTSATTCYGIICDNKERSKDCCNKVGGGLQCLVNVNYYNCYNEQGVKKCCSSNN